jgi:hypothetical protein
MAYTPLVPDISHGSAFKTVSTHEFINPSLSAMLLDRFDRLFEVNLLIRLYHGRKRDEGTAPSALISLLLQKAEVLSKSRLQLGDRFTGLTQDFYVLQCAYDKGWPRETTATVKGANVPFEVSSKTFEDLDTLGQQTSDHICTYKTQYYGMCFNDEHSRYNLLLKRPFAQTNWGCAETTKWWSRPGDDASKESYNKYQAHPSLCVSLLDLTRRLRHILRVLMDTSRAHELKAALAAHKGSPSINNQESKYQRFQYLSLTNPRNPIATQEVHGIDRGAIIRSQSIMKKHVKIPFSTTFLDVGSTSTLTQRIITGLKRFGLPRKVYEFVNPACAAHINIKDFSERIGLTQCNDYVLVAALKQVNDALRSMLQRPYKLNYPGAAEGQQQPSPLPDSVLAHGRPNSGAYEVKAIENPKEISVLNYLEAHRDASVFPSSLFEDAALPYLPLSLQNNISFHDLKCEEINEIGSMPSNGSISSSGRQHKFHSKYLIGERQNVVFSSIELMDVVRLCVMCSKVPPWLHSIASAAARMPTWWSLEHSLALFGGICKYGYKEWATIISKHEFPRIEIEVRSPEHQRYLLRSISCQQLDTLVRVICENYVELLLNWSETTTTVSAEDEVSEHGDSVGKGSSGKTITKRNLLPPPTAVDVTTFYMKLRRFPSTKDIVLTARETN